MFRLDIFVEAGCDMRWDAGESHSELQASNKMEAYASTLSLLTYSLTHLSGKFSCIGFEACPRVPL